MAEDIDKKQKISVINACRRGLKLFRKMWAKGIRTKTYHGIKYSVYMVKEHRFCSGVLAYYDFVVYDRTNETVYFVRHLIRRWKIYQVLHDVKPIDRDGDKACITE